jgi:predicted  nucleic acid-binding Zn-ribbon protein
MWPQLTNIEEKIYNRILQKSQPQVASTLNPWIRVFSGAVVGGKQGLILSSNNMFPLFRAAGQNTATVYGTDTANGAIGITWDNKIVGGGADRGYRPNPIIIGFDVKEGTDQISREGTLQVKCFSLYQLEYLQKYLMEPGYSLCVEWGWNTVSAAKNIINDKGGVSGILKAATDINLDNDALHTKRVSSLGDYDTYLGFIIGCSIKSDGEAFTLEVRMKGSPSLPTFMQSQTKIQKTDEKGNIIKPESVKPFGPSELIDGGNVAGPRRFKKMFNNLPAHRQLKEIKDLASEAQPWDYIGFDEVVQDQIDDFHDGGEWYKSGDDGNEFEVEGVDIKKDGLISDKKFIRMSELVKILNINGGLEGFKMGDKELSLKINIDNTAIGAFPNMFSTKAEKLIIPGSIPDFSVYYLSSADVIQNDGGVLNDTPPLDTSIDFNGTSFVQNSQLNQNGLKEKANYWGYLKNLYVNFDVFKSALESKNKNIREIFTDILNDCSSAVNSFWNFQIKEETLGNKVIITVYDENWIGNKPQDEPPVKFHHSGINSPFLNADLDMSIPGSMASQIVARRLSFATNPDEQKIEMGNFFSSETDLFLQNAISSGELSGPSETNDTSEESSEEITLKKSETLQNEISDLDTQIQALKTKRDAASSELREKRGIIWTDEENRPRVKQLTKEVTDYNNEITQLQRTRNNKNSEKTREAAKERQAEKEAAEEAKKANLTSNLEKLTIIPKPNKSSIGELSNDSIQKKENAISKFGFYTFKDEGYFDRLRNNAFSKGNVVGKLSHPLPIKYSFTILGSSGLRRGDMFNIIGIPTIYTSQGLFQIINVSHQLDGMNWKTTIEGQYRQKS